MTTTPQGGLPPRPGGPGPAMGPGPRPGMGGPQGPWNGPPPQGMPPQGVPPQGTPPQGGSSNKKLFIAIGAGIAVLLLILASVLTANAVQNHRAEQEREQTLAEATEGAQQAVQTYLQALADADAESALAQAHEPPEGPLLTDEVLSESNESGGVSSPEVTSASMNQHEDGSVPNGTVTASYTVGGEDVTADFAVTHTPQGWKLDDVTGEGDVGPGTVLVNGVEASGSVEMFPGTYALEAANDRVELDATEENVTDPAEAEPVTWSVSPSLSDKGKKDIVAAGRKALDRCLAKKELAPSGCPMIAWKVDPNVKVDAATIKHTLTNDPWAGFDPGLDPSGTQVQGTLTIGVHTKGDAIIDGAPGYVDDKQDKTVRYTADISGPEVTFSFGIGG